MIEQILTHKERHTHNVLCLLGVVVLTLILFPVLFTATAHAADEKLSEIKRATPEVIQNWRDLRFGIFIHWGPVSLTGEEIGWSRGKQTPADTYDQLYKKFNPKKFDASRWVKLFKNAGAQYVVLTTKHHDGFCLWDSKYTDYDIMSTPYNRDIVGALTDACKKHGLEFGPYYSVADWYQPDYPKSHGAGPGYELDRTPDMDRYVRYMKRQLKELQNKHGPFHTVWFDGEWEKPWTHERGVKLNNYVRSLQPVVMINNRVDKGRKGMEGTFKKGSYAGDYATPEQQVGTFNRSTPWETCITIGDQWAWNPDGTNKSLDKCIQILVQTVGGDGNLLLNVGPKPNGRIGAGQRKRLKQIDHWMNKYGTGIYETRGGPFKPGKWGGSTCKGNHIYLFLTRDPGTDILKLPAIDKQIKEVHTLSPGTANVTQGEKNTTVQLKNVKSFSPAAVIKLTIDGDAMNLDPVDVQTK